MLFNSFEFLIYFIVVTTMYFLLPHRFRWFFLLLASCYFYLTFLPLYILILFFTIVVDYWAGIWIEKTEDNERKQRWILVGAVVLNIAILGVFKYWDFIVDSFNYSLQTHWPLLQEFWASAWIVKASNALNATLNQGLGTSYPIIRNVILPLGLSFHTFQALAYLYEIYRGNQKAERHFGIYSLYVMFYPQLVAGPIERPQQILPQFRIRHRFNLELFWSGVRLMLWGLFKKVVVADRLARYVDIVFNDYTHHTHYLNIALALVFFLVQVYCDFSGYSDMALGAARTMGFDLMVNFNRPFQSKSITEYWRRWHISLSSWFNDYLFTNVSASLRRLRKTGILLAVLITFGLSGLWHGAAWTFVVFGLLHGAAIVFEILTRSVRMRIGARLPERLWNFLCGLATLSFAVLVVAFFRATSFHQAWAMLGNLFSFTHTMPFQKVVMFEGIEFGVTSLVISVFLIVLTVMVERYLSPRMLELDQKPKLDILFTSVTLLLILTLGVFQKASFIYFQF